MLLNTSTSEAVNEQTTKGEISFFFETFLSHNCLMSTSAKVLCKQIGSNYNLFLADLGGQNVLSTFNLIVLLSNYVGVL